MFDKVRDLLLLFAIIEFNEMFHHKFEMKKRRSKELCRWRARLSLMNENDFLYWWEIVKRFMDSISFIFIDFVYVCSDDISLFNGAITWFEIKYALSRGRSELITEQIK